MAKRPGIHIEADARDMSRLERRLSHIRNGFPRVVAGAINDTLGPVRTAISRAVREEINLKASDVKPLILLRRANPAKLEGHVNLSRRSVRLAKYGATAYSAAGERDERGKFVKRGTGSNTGGVRVKVRKGEPTEKIKSAFLAPFRAGDGLHEGVFIRKTAARYPIKQLQGPTAVGVLANEPGMLEEQQAQANQRFGKRLEYRANRLLDRD